MADTADDRFHELLLRYGAFLRRTIGTLCPRDSGVSCDDIEQEARIGLWTVLRGEREIGFPASYIYRVAVSATVRAIRRARARREEPLPDEAEAAIAAPSDTLRAPAGESPHALAERLELRRQINTALAGLPGNRRTAVTLYLQGLTTTEIGGLCGWSEAKARNLVYRGREDMQKALRKMGIEYR